MAAQFHWNPDTYLEMIRAEVPSFDALQAAAVASVPFPPGSALDLGIGTGETSRRLLEAHPEARITGLDSSPEMVFRARRLGIEVRLARIAGLWVKGAYLPFSRFSGGGSAGLSLEVGLGVEVGAATDRIQGFAGFEYQRIDREAAADVPLQFSLGQLGIRFRP